MGKGLKAPDRVSGSGAKSTDPERNHDERRQDQTGTEARRWSVRMHCWRDKVGLESGTWKGAGSRWRADGGWMARLGRVSFGPETRRAATAPAIWASRSTGECAAGYVSARKAPATPRRDALSPRCAHPRLSPCHTSPTPQPRSNAASIAPRFLPLSVHHVGRSPHLSGDALRRHGHPAILCNNPLPQASLSTVLCDRVHLSSHVQRPPT